MRQLPHRYPFLLIDRVVAVKPGESLTALKNVTINEPFFPGHFPHKPVMPGVLMLEAMAQACGLLAFATLGGAPGNTLFYFVAIDGCRFRDPVEPGDQLVFEVRYVTAKRNIWKFAGVAKVDGKVVCEAELMCAAREEA
jgi:3-hydroxyacyl-[acyl-carrier-protein] dehydratase